MAVNFNPQRAEQMDACPFERLPRITGTKTSSDATEQKQQQGVNTH
jgi:hypothetical protein